MSSDVMYDAHSTMVRTQIQLSEDQYRRLKELSVQRSQSLSQLVCESVDQLIDTTDRDRRRERALQLMGSFRTRDGARDVSVRHDEELEGAFGDH